MEKHAYLVMAHNNFSVLKKQLELLDDERNDFYLHIDKRAKDFNQDWLLQNIRYSKIRFIKRRKVYWADYTQTQAELDLIKEALNMGGGYSYLHLLSGSDLPIKSKDEIYNFFKDSKKIYLCCGSTTDRYQEKRTRYYYPFIKTKIFRKSKLVKGLSLILGRCQAIIFINRHKKKENYSVCYHGMNWFSIPQDFAQYVLLNEKKIYSTFHHTLASDESFMQTIAMNSEFKDRIYKFNCTEDSIMRRIDWNRGKPYTFRVKDFEEVIKSPYLFVRKIEEHIDDNIAKMIFNEMQYRNANWKA